MQAAASGNSRQDLTSARNVSRILSVGPARHLDDAKFFADLVKVDILLRGALSRARGCIGGGFAAGVLMLLLLHVYQLRDMTASSRMLPCLLQHAKTLPSHLSTCTINPATLAVRVVDDSDGQLLHD